MALKPNPKIDELRKECVEKGLDDSGNLNELKARLKKFNTQEKSDLFKGIATNSNQTVKEFALAETTFLIQMKVENLSMYFVHGCFYPLNLETSAVYRDQNRKADLFTTYSNSIPLAKGVVDDFDETQVLVEVIFTQDELARFLQIDKLYFFNEPIPISRVSALYFFNNSVRTSYLASVDVFPDAFVPPALCKLIPESISTIQSAPGSTEATLTSQWHSMLARYDRLLGMIAFLKNTALFYTDRTDEYQEYTSSYFSVLSNINGIEVGHQKDNSFFKWIIDPSTIEIDGKIARFQFKEILDAVYAGVEFDIEWAIRLLENSSLNEQTKEGMDQLREILKVFIDYRKLRIDYRTVLSHPFIQNNIPITILVFLIKFPNKSLGHSDKQAVKNYFRSNDNKVERSTAEFIFATLGLYYGYSNMVKEDHIDLKDPYFNTLAKNNAHIKFKLDSYLDRFTIESIYQFALANGQRVDNYFTFLKDIQTPILITPSLPRNVDVEYIDRSMVKFEKRIITLRRIGANAVLARVITEQYQPQITQKDHLFTYVAKYHPELLSIDRDKLSALILADPVNKSLSELRDTIELDKKYGRNTFKR